MEFKCSLLYSQVPIIIIIIIIIRNITVYIRKVGFDFFSKCPQTAFINICIIA